MKKVEARMTEASLVWRPKPRTKWQNFCNDPGVWIARLLHSCRPRLATTSTKPSQDQIKLVCISDTHNTQPFIPEGDILLHAGDLTNSGTFHELQSQLDWLASLPHPHKVVTAGNHDRLLDAEFIANHPERIIETPGSSRDDLNWHDIIYLQNSAVTISMPTPATSDTPRPKPPSKSRQPALKIYGSPWTPFCGTFAFQYPPIRDVWQETVPFDTDIVLTHGPPKGYLDSPNKGYENKGCPHLLRELSRVRPKVAVFGHIHSAFGTEQVQWTMSVDKYYAQLIGVAEEQRARRLMLWRLVIAIAYGLVAAWVTAVFQWAIRKDPKGQRTTIVNAAIGADEGSGREPVIVPVSLSTEYGG